MNSRLSFAQEEYQDILAQICNFLPSSKSKHAIWKLCYEADVAEGTIHSVVYTTFCYLWCKLVPYIPVMKPCFELCQQYQQK